MSLVTAVESVLVEAGISLDIETGLLTIGVDGTLACPADFFLASGPFASLTITVDGVDILVPLSLSAEVGADLASVNVEAALGIDLVALLNAELEIDLDLGLGLADILDALAGLGLDLELDLDVNGTVSIICSTVPLTVAVDIDG